MKILILASNPRKDLNLDREIRDLKNVIEASLDRQQFEVEDALAVRVGDLQDLLFRHRPQIVHFCGHGSGQQGLVFEGNDGGEQWVRAEALSDLFRLFSTNVGCVLLNACYSEEQANAIVNHIDYVIGMNQEIRDDAAIAFAKGFYRALGYECSVEQAYEFGKNAIQLEISGSSKMRSAATEEVVRKAEVVGTIQSTAIPEHLKPILKTKPTLAPSARANITAPDQLLSHETSAAIQVEIDKSLEADTKVKQYRDRVREFLVDRKLSVLEEMRLERFRKDLGLPIEKATRILEEEWEPIRKAQEEYKEMLIQLIEGEHYPFDAEINRELQQLRQELDLTDSEVETISNPILEAAEEKYQKQSAQESRNSALWQTDQEDLDITLELALTAEEMAGGTEKLISIEQDKITVKVPAGVTAGKRIRVRGKGKVSQQSQHHGDLYLTVVQAHSPSLGELKSSENLRSERAIDYTTLQNLLSSGRWAEADRETMQVLLKAVNRLQQGWVRLEDCVKFPCVDLCTINHLWTQHSGGRFSLVTQKQAWRTVSRTSDRKYIIRDFCRATGSAQIRKGAVGWWSGDRILSIEEIYEHFIDSGSPDASSEKLNAMPEGLLPALAHWSWLETGKQANCLAAFFAHLEDCKI
jgi:curved DNA-binding protein CbpA